MVCVVCKRMIAGGYYGIRKSVLGVYFASGGGIWLCSGKDIGVKNGKKICALGLCSSM